jgi:hypothetical protein
MDTEPKGPPNLSEIRKKSIKAKELIYKDPREIIGLADWDVFVAANPDQLTRKIVGDMLKGEEYRNYKMAETALHEKDPRDFDSVYYYDRWSNYNDAVKGLIGEGPISPTIDVLKNNLASYHRLIRDAQTRIMNGGPFNENPFQEIPKLEKAISIWTHISENYETAIRIASAPQGFTVSSEQTN